MSSAGASPFHWAWLILTGLAFLSGFSLGWLKKYGSGLRLSIASAGLLCIWLAAAMLGRLIQENAGTAGWISPWVWSSGATAQLSFGIHATELRVTLAWALVSLSSIGFFTLLLDPETRNQDALFSGLLLSAAASIFGLGVSQEWLTMGAVSLGALGASLVTRGQWGEVEQASSLARMLFNRYLGWLVFVCGVLVAAAQSTEATGHAGISGALLALGIWIAISAFPWSSSISSTESAVGFLRPLVTEIFPGLMIVLLAVELSKAMTVPSDGFGIYWVFVLSSSLTSLVGLFQRRSDTVASFALAGLLALALAAATLGQVSAALWIGVGALVLRALNLFAHQLGARGSAVMKFSAAFTLGLPISIGFAGLQRLLVAASAQPGLVLVILLAIFANLLLVWKAAMILVGEEPKKTGPVVWVGVSFSSVGGLALLWTGAWFAGGFAGKDEVMFSSWSSQVLGLATEELDLASLQTWGAALLGVQAAALVVAYLSVQRKGDRWIAAETSSPRFFGFVSSGFFWSRFGNQAVEAVSLRLERMEKFFASRLSGPTLAKIRARSGPLAASWVTRSEQALERSVSRSTQTAIDVPGRLLQLVQNGDVQWYLALSLVLILSFLAHAMRTPS